MPSTFDHVIDLGDQYVGVTVEYSIIPADMSVGCREEIEFLVFLDEDTIIDGKSHKKDDCINHLLSNKLDLEIIDACLVDNSKTEEYDLD